VQKIHAICMAVLVSGLCAVSAVHAAEAQCKIVKFGELPVTVQNGRALLKATVNGQEATFIVDSGAFYSTLTKESAARLGLAVGQLRSGIDVVGLGGRADAHQTSVKSLLIPGLAAGTLKDVEFLVLGNIFAGEADGLLGENVLGAADTEYDLRSGVIRLMHSRGCDNTKMAYWTTSSEFAMMSLAGRSALNSLVVGHATLNGADISVVFDSGAPQSNLSLKVAARLGVTPTSPGVSSGGVRFGIGPEVTETWIGRFSSLNLGGEEIKNIALRFGPLRLADDADMLLGLDFFLSHRIYIAKNQNRLFFTYNGGKVFDLSILHDAERNKRADSAPPVQAVDRDPHVADKDFAQPDTPTPQNPSVELRTAFSYEANRDFPQAIERFNRWVSENPKDDRIPRVLHERCWCRAASGVELESALADCDTAIKRHNDDSQARVNRGLVWLRLDMPDKAIADFKEAIEKQPKSPWAFFGRGIAESRKGDVARATQDFKSATELDATVADQYRAIGLEPSP